MAAEDTAVRDEPVSGQTGPAGASRTSGGAGSAERLRPTLGWRPAPKGSLPGGIALVAAGIVTLVVAIGVLTHVAAEIRVILSIAAVVAVYYGADMLAKRVFGPKFQTGLWLSGMFLSLVTLAAVFADLLPLKEARDSSKTFLEPIRARPDLFSKHPLGTDDQGLDTLGGLIYGSRVSLIVGIGAVIIGLAVGGLLGVVAGYRRGLLDRILDVFVTSALAFPPLVLLLAIAAVLPRNTRNITLALALLSIPSYVRLARANTLVLAQREFVIAARAFGAKDRRIVLRELVPSVLTSLLSYAFVIIAVVIVAEAGLSFLGLSIPRPEPTLGNMISAGQTRFDTVPHMVFVPATFLFLIVLSLNRLGEEARKRFDPRQSKL